jgi:hypothetical protein
VLLDLLAGTFLRLAATYGSSHRGGQHQSVTGAAGRLPGARMQVHPTNLSLDLVDLAFAVPSPPGSIASCSASGGSHCSVASSSPPVIDSAYVVWVSQAAACEDWIASTIVATGCL